MLPMKKFESGQRKRCFSSHDRTHDQVLIVEEVLIAPGTRAEHLGYSLSILASVEIADRFVWYRSVESFRLDAVRCEGIADYIYHTNSPSDLLMRSLVRSSPGQSTACCV